VPEKLKVSVLSESAYGGQGQGVHTAFVDCVDILSSRADVEVHVNSAVPCDVLHAHTFGPLYWWRWRQYKGRCLLSAHVVPASMEGSLLLWQLWLPLFVRYIRFTYNSADVVIAVAPAVKRALAQIGVTSKMIVLTNPVNLDKFRPDASLRAQGRELLKLKADDQVALCVGQIQPRKGVADFIQAARANPGVQFVWGGGRPFSVLTDAYAQMNRLMEAKPANAHFPGLFDLARMPAIYNAADLFFFPSFQENCALAIAEAAACGLPLLLRDLDDYRELYGLNFLSAADSAGFNARVGEFFATEDMVREYREKSKEVAKRFDVRLLGEKLVEAYRSLYLKGA
jgi:1,2-diacylglycerol-3-alpha-glucose alpha-1,2-galactosyltransferase